jgi:hypothetical protein
VEISSAKFLPNLMENVGSTHYFMPFPLKTLTWHAGTFIDGVQHVAAAVILAWIALTQMGADFYFTVDTCGQQSYMQQVLTRPQMKI